MKDISTKIIGNNKELIEIKKILGLESGKKYKDTNSLRYGKVMVMTDQDHDGSHIKGLLLNIFHTLWPELLKLNYIIGFVTPIVKANHNKKIKVFYTMTDYENWKEKINNINKWNIKYYKGLGTSTSAEAKDYFKKMRINNYIAEEDIDDAMNLAFKKSEVDSRKDWLYKYNPQSVLDYTEDKITVGDFINKELIHFSNADNMRSIGSVFDGLKPSQRKVLYCSFKRKLTKEIKVAQFSGYISEHAAYHHGEMSLQSTIIGMAQNYVGSNNINLLEPCGQFGTRMMGGKDSASPRYIHTMLNPIINNIYPQDDNILLNYLNDDGQNVEPEYYIPIIPMILVNGMLGIGTGFSTSIPKFNPKDIIKNIKNKLNKKPYLSMKPWYRGYTGDIIKISNYHFISMGKYTINKNQEIEINELPINTWTDDYKLYLDKLLEKNEILDYTNHSTDTEVKFIIKVDNNILYDNKYLENDNCDKIQKKLKLTSQLKLTNLHCYDKEGKINKYNSIYDILDEHYYERYNLYIQRKENQINNYNNILKKLNNKIRFINEIISDELIIYKKKKINIIKELYDKKYDYLVDGKYIYNNDINIDNLINLYDYLIKMPLYDLSEEKIDELEKDIHNNKLKLEELMNLSIEGIWGNELDLLNKKL